MERQPEEEGDWQLVNPLAESSVESASEDSKSDDDHDDDAGVSSFGGLPSSMGEVPSPPQAEPSESENPQSSLPGIPSEGSVFPPEETITQSVTHTVQVTPSFSRTPEATESATISPSESSPFVPPEVPNSVDVEFTILGLSQEAFTPLIQLELVTNVARAANVTVNDTEIVSVVEQEGFLGRKFRSMDRRVRGIRGLEVTLYVVVRIAGVSQARAAQVADQIANDVQTVGGFEVRTVELLPPAAPPVPSPTPDEHTMTPTESHTQSPSETKVPPSPPMAPPLPPTTPGQVDLQIVVVVAADEFTAAAQEIFIAELARVLGVAPSQIQVIRVDLVDLDGRTGNRLRTTRAGASRHLIKNDASESEGARHRAVSIEARVSGLPPNQTAEKTSQIIQTAANNNHGQIGAFEISSVVARDNNNQLPNAARKSIGFHHGISLSVGLIVGLASLFLLC